MSKNSLKLTTYKSKIFISYRREDTAPYAGRLRDALVNQFGAQQVFMDIYTIRPGEHFTKVIEQTVGSCDALIAVIGRRWLGSIEGLVRRIDDPTDFVRVEITNALDRNIPVFPVLVNGAAAPRPQDLPKELEPITKHNILEISDNRWDYDVGQLISTLKGVLRKPTVSRFGLGVAIAVSCIAILMIGLIIKSQLSTTTANVNEPAIEKNRNLSVNASKPEPIKIEPNYHENVNTSAVSIPTPHMLFNIWNEDAFMGNPPFPMEFAIDRPYMITKIYNRHRGLTERTPPGEGIKLFNSAGKEVGSWNVFIGDIDTWMCKPEIELQAGTYTIIDPDPATWSQNESSKHRGMSMVEGYAMPAR